MGGVLRPRSNLSLFKFAWLSLVLTQNRLAWSEADNKTTELGRQWRHTCVLALFTDGRCLLGSGRQQMVARENRGILASRQNKKVLPQARTLHQNNVARKVGP